MKYVIFVIFFQKLNIVYIDLNGHLTPSSILCNKASMCYSFIRWERVESAIPSRFAISS